MTTTSACLNDSCGSAVRPSFRGRLRRVHEVLQLWHRRKRQRRKLMQMPDDILKDIGISRVDAYQESRKPFWRA